MSYGLTKRNPRNLNKSDGRKKMGGCSILLLIDDQGSVKVHCSLVFLFIPFDSLCMICIGLLFCFDLSSRVYVFVFQAVRGGIVGLRLIRVVFENYLLFASYVSSHRGYVIVLCCVYKTVVSCKTEKEKKKGIRVYMELVFE